MLVSDIKDKGTDERIVREVVDGLTAGEIPQSTRYLLDPSRWAAICGDPEYKFFRQEMENLAYNKEELKRLMAGRKVLVVYGGGGHQKEALTARFMLEAAGSGPIQVYSFDTCADYEDSAREELQKQLGADNFRLTFHQATFEDSGGIISEIQPDDGRCFVCYGGTAGNYTNAFRIFAGNMGSNDIMIYGLKTREGSTDGHIDGLVREYSGRPDWMLGPLLESRGEIAGLDSLLSQAELVPDFDPETGFLTLSLSLSESDGAVDWRYNGSSGTYQPGDSLVVFRTRRPTISSLVKEAQEAGHGEPKLIATHPEYKEIVDIVL